MNCYETFFFCVNISAIQFIHQWTNHKWPEFYEKCKNAIETFNVLVVRVHDIYANRILNVLSAMQEISLQTLPNDGELWTMEEFLEKNEESCR